MNVNLDEQMLPVYRPAFYNESRFLVLKGGAGSGKSVFAAQKIITRCIMESGHRFLVLRKVDRTLEASVYQLFKDILHEWELYDKCEVWKQPMKISIPSVDGGTSEVLFRGLDDPEKIKSIQGVSGEWLEEATEFEEEDLTQLNIRLRGETTGYKQIMLTFNPISEKHWLKKVFYDNRPDNAFVVETNYLDNTFLDSDYINELKKLSITAPDEYRVYCLGEWGTIRTGQEFFHQFKRSVHVKEVSYDADKWLIVARDFNNLPYMTAILLQGQGDSVQAIDEVCLAPPRNTIEDTVDEIYNRYPEIKVVIETGDPSGKAKVARKTRMEAKNYYAQVKKCWQEKGVSMIDKVPKSAPPLASRKSAYGKLLSGAAGIDLTISPRCTNLIHDFESLQQDVSGGWVKRKVKDKKTGASYEEGGHCADALTYYLAVQYPDLFASRKSRRGMLAG